MAADLGGETGDRLAVFAERLAGSRGSLQLIVDLLAARGACDGPEQCRAKAAGAENKYRPVNAVEHCVELRACPAVSFGMVKVM